MKNQFIKKSLGILSLIVLTAVISINTKSLNTTTSDFSLVNLISLNTANAENGYSCTVSSTCFMGLGTVSGSVSCSGSNCSRGTEWVKCDGKKTEC